MVLDSEAPSLQHGGTLQHGGGMSATIVWGRGCESEKFIPRELKKKKYIYIQAEEAIDAA